MKHWLYRTIYEVNFNLGGYTNQYHGWRPPMALLNYIFLFPVAHPAVSFTPFFILTYSCTGWRVCVWMAEEGIALILLWSSSLSLFEVRRTFFIKNYFSCCCSLTTLELSCGLPWRNWSHLPASSYFLSKILTLKSMFVVFLSKLNVAIRNITYLKEICPLKLNKNLFDYMG